MNRSKAADVDRPSNTLPAFTGQVQPFRLPENFLPYTSNVHRSLLRRACYQRGLAVRVIEGDDERWIASSATRSVRFYRNMPPSTTQAALRIAYNKHLTKSRLDQAGIPVPAGIVIASDETAKAAEWYDAQGGRPVVVKPVSGYGGRGVSSGIADKADFLDAIRHAGSDRVIVETHVSGADHRLFVVGGRFVAAVRRHPATVVGDGQSSIEELVEARNRVRRKLPYIRDSLVKFDDQTAHLLALAGLDRTSIPAKGEAITLKRVANVSMGGDSEDVTEMVHPDFRAIAERCWRAIPELTFCGIDMMAEDITRPASGQSHGVIEINPNCDLAVHLFTTLDRGGLPVDVAGAVIDYIFPDLPAPEAATEEFLISGLVQGVGFRAWLRGEAALLGVSGECMNLPDGRVRAVVQGSRTALDELATRCAIGPKNAQPTYVDRAPHPAISGHGMTIVAAPRG